MTLTLRPSQAAILAYENGRLAVSAVPGSGKTFTLSLLAAQLIGNGRINPDAGQSILIVTFLNASVDTFRARIRKRLDEMELPADRGYDVRTLHSLALEIVKQSESGLGSDRHELAVLDDGQRSGYLARAIDDWIGTYPDMWTALLPDNNPNTQQRWRRVVEDMAAAFIRTAKNERYHPEAIQRQMDTAASRPEWDPDAPRVQESPYLYMLAGIYTRYQNMLLRQGHMDFDDLIWQAVNLLEQRPDLVDIMHARWPYVLEDEAQDSVPLQELLLNQLTGANGNWVRVGDPNQAITSTFTAAHPRFFNAFLNQPDVTERPLPNSGRCAPLIFGAANALVDWVIDKHPEPEVRAQTFRRQHIVATPPGDSQPNPPDSEANIRIKVYKQREDEELPAIARLAARYMRERPAQTAAILVPTHQIGHQLAEHLDDLDADYDNLLRGGMREREIAGAIHAILALLANPLDKNALIEAHATLNDLGHQAANVGEERLEHLHTLMRSIYRPEDFLFPWEDGDLEKSYPANIATPEDMADLSRFADYMRKLFELRPLPVDDMVLALGDELFAQENVREGDLAIAYQIASVLRSWRESQPDWRLPRLSDELREVASGRRRLPLARPSDYGYEPQPGRITLATQHGAKGLEWDAVFLVGIDSRWIPGSLDAYFQGVNDDFGGDPKAEVTAQLRYLMQGNAGLYPGCTATESAHIDIISERLRLLYVGVTRARRYLHISRSRTARQGNTERPAEPATVLGVLYHYLKTQKG